MALTPTKLELLNNSDANKLKKNNKDDLCSYIMHLKEKVEELASYQLISKRVELLERSHIQSLQYDRRESLELQGIPEKIKDDDLESCCRHTGRYWMWNNSVLANNSMPPLKK